MKTYVISYTLDDKEEWLNVMIEANSEEEAREIFSIWFACINCYIEEVYLFSQ